MLQQAIAVRLTRPWRNRQAVLKKLDAWDRRVALKASYSMSQRDTERYVSTRVAAYGPTK